MPNPRRVVDSALLGALAATLAAVGLLGCAAKKPVPKIKPGFTIEFRDVQRQGETLVCHYPQVMFDAVKKVQYVQCSK